MDNESFAAGAMRECFRMYVFITFILLCTHYINLTLIFRKKLSNFSHNQDWGRDSNNYVAKRYMDEEVFRSIQFVFYRGYINIEMNTHRFLVQLTLKTSNFRWMRNYGEKNITDITHQKK